MWGSASRAFGQRYEKRVDSATCSDCCLCIGAYSAGVTVVTTVAGVYAQQVLQLSQVETISLLVVVNLSAAAGAFAFGYIQDRFGSKRTIAITLLLWIATTLGAAFIDTTMQLFVIGNMAGVAIGSSQSAGRAMVALFSPGAKAAEFFGLWGMAVKAASIVGPLTYGITNYATGSHTHRPGDHHRVLSRRPGVVVAD